LWIFSKYQNLFRDKSLPGEGSSPFAGCKGKTKELFATMQGQVCGKAGLQKNPGIVILMHLEKLTPGSIKAKTANAFPEKASL